MISVVIPNYNGNKYLEMCINSLLRLEEEKLEIIVIDNASEDSDYQWIKIYKNILFKKLDNNYGFSTAVNQGIKLAKGEYVILLNNDTVVEEGFVQSLVDTIKNDKTIFSVSSKMIQYHNRELIDDAGDEYTILGWAYKCGDNSSITAYNSGRKVFSVCAGAAIYRKAVFDEIGYFDETFFAYMEDVDISYRAMIYGYKNMYCPDAKVYHVGSATSGSKYNGFKVELAARNNIYVPYKNMPFPQFVINMPFLLLGFLIKYVFFLKNGFGKDYKRGFIEGVMTLHKIDRINFKWKNFFRYIYIEWLLIINIIIYIIIFIKKKIKRI